MKQTLFYEKIRNSAYGILNTLAAQLPLWKETAVAARQAPLLKVPVNRPLNYATLPAAFAVHFIDSKHIPPRRIFQFQNVWVSSEAVVFKNLRIFTPSLPWLSDLDKHRSGALLAQQWIAPKSPFSASDPPVALVYDQWAAENYYHWMIESLPRLLMLKEFYPDCILLLPTPAPAFIGTTAGMMGMKNIYPLRRHYDTALSVPKLLLPELIYYYEERENPPFARALEAGLPEPDGKAEGSALKQELILGVRQLLLAHFKKPARVFRKVYASRASQKTRRLHNEQEILPLLEKFGFEVVYFETLSFEAQVELMLETRIFLGIHGANMVNMLFLPESSIVIEMMNEDHFNEAYYLLASSLQLPYYSIPCSMADTGLKTEENGVLRNDADLLVNRQLLEKTIQSSMEMLENTTPPLKIVVQWGSKTEES